MAWTEYPPSPGDPAGTDHVDARVDHDVLLHAAELTLDSVERALCALDEGTYGTCDACGEPVGEETLEADPTARWCTLHTPGAGD